MKKRLLSTSISTLLLGLSVMPAFADEDVTAWRLFIADHDKPVVNVIDALDGDKLATFNVKGPANLSRSESGATIFAIQGSAGVVSTIASGIAFHDHGDHADIDIDAPKLLPLELTGKKPGHFVERQGKISQWFDGEDSAQILGESAVLKGQKNITKVNVVAPHLALLFLTIIMLSYPFPTLMMRQNDLSALAWWTCKVKKWVMMPYAPDFTAQPARVILLPYHVRLASC